MCKAPILGTHRQFSFIQTPTFKDSISLRSKEEMACAFIIPLKLTLEDEKNTKSFSLILSHRDKVSLLFKRLITIIHYRRGGLTLHQSLAHFSWFLTNSQFSINIQFYAIPVLFSIVSKKNMHFVYTSNVYSGSMCNSV